MSKEREKTNDYEWLFQFPHLLRLILKFLFKQRERIGDGFDHEVWGNRKYEDGDIEKEDGLENAGPVEWVFKAPHLFTFLLTLLDREDHLVYLEKELQEAQAKSARTGIMIPKTRIVRTKRFYVIVQERVHPDPDSDVKAAIEKLAEKNPDIWDDYDFDNGYGHFKVSKRVVYCTDPFSSFFRRLVEKYRVVDKHVYKKTVKTYLSAKEFAIKAKKVFVRDKISTNGIFET